jgi:type II secretory pathway pseudopilin PulG
MNMRFKVERSRREGGYVLLGILFALTLLVIALAAAAPRALTSAKRAKEGELVRRGTQYQIAIRRFYKKFGRYPGNIDQLENTNNIRFLRRRYLDPLTGKDDWVAIQYGQARPSVGFFGQKLVTTGGTSPSGLGLGPSSSVGGPQSLSGTSSNPNPNGGFTGSNSNSQFGSASSASASSSQFGSASSTSASGSQFGSSLPPGNSATGTPTSDSSTGAPANGPSGSAGNPISSSQLSGHTFGGGAIVGVSVPVQKESLKEFQQKKHYNEWQFVYDPTLDTTLRGGAGAGVAGGTPGATPGLNPGFGGQNNLNGTSPNGFSQGSSTTPNQPAPPTPTPNPPQ